MNIEQIALEVSSEMSKEARAMEGRAMMTEFLHRCLSKLAEQTGEPVAWMCWLNGDTEMNSSDAAITRCEPMAYKNRVKLYTETQLIAAQQRTAEACAKLCEAGRSEDGEGQHRAWYAGFDMCIDAIQNGDWREYL